MQYQQHQRNPESRRERDSPETLALCSIRSMLLENNFYNALPVLQC